MQVRELEIRQPVREPITSALVETYLVTLDSVGSASKHSSPAILQEDLPYLPDLLAARSQVPMPSHPVPHLIAGTPLADVTSTYTINNWQWARNDEQGVSQSVSRLLIQHGRRLQILDVYSDPVPFGSMLSIGRRNYVAYTEHSRVFNLLTHLQNTGAQVKGWVPFLSPQ